MRHPLTCSRRTKAGQLFFFCMIVRCRSAGKPWVETQGKVLTGVVSAKGCEFLLTSLGKGIGVRVRLVGFPVENEGKGATSTQQPFHPISTPPSKASRFPNLVAPYCAIPRDYLSDTPLLRAMGFLVSQHGQMGAIPPPPFLSASPLESMQTGGAIPPPPTEGVSQRYLRDTLWKQGKWVRYPPLRYYLERVLRDREGGISHWAAKFPKLQRPGVPRHVQHNRSWQNQQYTEFREKLKGNN